ncbi:MAG: aminotransferase class I/II-fold pyridoxal phosphate-dependent enzyme [Clostridia bacterium]|nr:aminotransferase class I/II-fold pyridoxal phosphate-dependent enzyme [Clostridia bacterium]
MNTFLTDKNVLADCKIYQMLLAHAQKEHLSFHTPGHKVGAWDITELSFSDNLSCPRGCIAEAEKDMAKILGAEKSFILTDGSTAGVLSMLYAAKTLGVKTLAVCENSHKSVFNGCAMLGITPLVYPCEYREKIPQVPTMSALKQKYTDIIRQADALFLTSPDYYGNVADWQEIRQYCTETGKLLLVDGAHGGHLHFDKTKHAGGYADLWVDGVHKSLPALTQGAVVSACDGRTADALSAAVDVFRTTSPSYPIMASVEYAVKYPRNEVLEKAAIAFQQHPRVYKNEDWTKLCVRFGKYAFEVEKWLERKGVYAEFCDGSLLTFYLSPATKMQDFERLQSMLTDLFIQYPLQEEAEKIPQMDIAKTETEWVPLGMASGRTCAGLCGLFPPCTPLFHTGEKITEEKIRTLQNASNVFGLKDGKISVYKEE